MSGHGLYMAGFCHYQQPKNDGKDLSEADVIAYLLATCGSCEEINGRLLHGSGLIHRHPGKRAKSASALATATPCSIASAASCASGTRFPVTPGACNN